MLGCATDTSEIVVLIPKPAVLTDTLQLLSPTADIETETRWLSTNRK